MIMAIVTHTAYTSVQDPEPELDLEAGLPLQDFKPASASHPLLPSTPTATQMPSVNAQTEHQTTPERNDQAFLKSTRASFLSALARFEDVLHSTASKYKVVFKAAAVILMTPFIITTIVLAAFIASILGIGAFNIILWLLSPLLAVFGEVVMWLMAGWDLRS
ncbi:uncharacterized protein DSM5745_02034 [Aspergillus mulundensis]|uniref:Uncharacterized protein n=1 Tax=Aspergillus mulundensis TaxID=1810919 RepID=A0A3D8SVG5_9EURO|nr:hypothetical protein DSM5745_02034 [Aspergillus mulundensis]RDW90259.1 hypothetical protein DSM5745_02034 [Aspergillus mulundensis]